MKLPFMVKVQHANHDMSTVVHCYTDKIYKTTAHTVFTTTKDLQWCNPILVICINRIQLFLN